MFTVYLNRNVNRTCLERVITMLGYVVRSVKRNRSYRLGVRRTVSVTTSTGKRKRVVLTIEEKWRIIKEISKGSESATRLAGIKKFMGPFE